MKKGKFSILCALLLPSMTSCGHVVSDSTNITSVQTVQMQFLRTSGDNQLFVVKSSDGTSDGLISLFGSVMYINIYNETEKGVAEIAKNFQDTMEYYHVLFDRHHTYAYKDNPDDVIHNLKYLNDSYGTGEWVTLEPILYDALKSAYDFTLQSEGYYSLFIGNLSDVYDEAIDAATEATTSSTGNNVYKYLSKMNKFKIYRMPSRLDIEKALKYTPQVVCDSEGNNCKFDQENILEFDDSKRAVKFNKYEVATPINSMKVSISMSGQGKGIATDKFIHDNPNKILLVNGGSSSITTNNDKTNGRPWKITFTNPAYKELSSMGLPINVNEYDVVYSHFGGFNLSTSGYYEQYYYAPFTAIKDEEGNVTGYEEWLFDTSKDYIGTANYEDIDVLKRISHIINPKTGYPAGFDSEVQISGDSSTLSSVDFVSIVTGDNLVTDMYTTALLATNCFDKALEVKNKLDDIYGDTFMVYSYKEYDDYSGYRKFLNYNPVPMNPDKPLDISNYVFDSQAPYQRTGGLNFKQVYMIPSNYSSDVYIDLDTVNSTDNVIADIRYY